MNIIIETIEKYNKIMYKDYEKQFLLSLKQLLKDYNLHDIEIECEKYVFSTQKVILCAISPFFHKILSNKNCGRIKIKNVSSEVMSKVLKLMYSGRVKVDKNIQFEFVHVLKEFEIIDIKTYQSMVEQLKTEIKEENQTGLLEDYETLLFRSPIRDDFEYGEFSTPTKGFDDVKEEESDSSGYSTPITGFEYLIKGELSPTFGLKQMDDYKYINPYKKNGDVLQRRPQNWVESTGCARVRIFEKIMPVTRYSLRNRTILYFPEIEILEPKSKRPKLEESVSGLIPLNTTKIEDNICEQYNKHLKI